MSPKVSVLMPNYNCEKYLPEAIESILNQSFTDFEFIIIDDCSTDNSWEIIQKFAEKDKRIIAMKNEENLKICKTLNRGLEFAKGEYIARMDSDDISIGERLKKQVKILDAKRNIGLVGTNCNFINKNGVKQGEKIYPEFNQDIKKAIWYRNPLLHPSVMFREEYIMETGVYNPEMIYAEDFELWLRIGKKCDFYNIQENLLLYRIFGGNSTIKKQGLMIKNTLKARKTAINLGYKIPIKGKIYYCGTWCMQFLPPKFVLWLFNKIT